MGLSDLSKAELTFSGYSENVPLLGSGDNGSTEDVFAGYYGKRDKLVTVGLGNAAASGGSAVVKFYVNETPSGDPFTVSLSTGSSSGVSDYTAQTRRSDIPRNKIYPLLLSFSDFDVELEPIGAASPIGGMIGCYELNYSGGFTITVAEGSFLYIKAAGMAASDGNAVDNVEWTWSIPQGQIVREMFKSSDPSELIVNFSAVKGFKCYLLLNARWSYNGVQYDRTYTVVTDVSIDITEIEYTGEDCGLIFSPSSVNVAAKRKQNGRVRFALEHLFMHE